MWRSSLLFFYITAQIVLVQCQSACEKARLRQAAIRIDTDEPSSEYSIQMCNASRSGLPKCSHCRNIAIIGAGVAGLTAAVELGRAGHRITVYEASNRTGGRVYTYRVPGTNYLTELGAMRLPLKVHPLLQTYIDDRYNLSVATFENSDPNAFIFLNNVLQTVRRTDEFPNAFGFDLTEEESRMVCTAFYIIL